MQIGNMKNYGETIPNDLMIKRISLTLVTSTTR